MITVCVVCSDIICCQDDGFPIMCCECPSEEFEIETGQICQSKLSSKEPILTVCPMCQLEILIHNAKYGGLNG